MTELRFMYGFPASGKTYYANGFVQSHPDWLYVGADAVRKELYGSQDVFGDSEEIFRVLTERMTQALMAGRSVIYDACNLYKSFRMDYLNILSDMGIECYKTCVRMNTTKATCLANHANRDRNFDIDRIGHYFDINEPPDMGEGWDWIVDVPDRNIPHHSFYIASPFFGEEERARAIAICERLRGMGHSVSLPLEHKFPDAYSMPNPEWGRAVFEYDVECIQASDFVVCLSYGRQSSAGTNWEAGYAKGIGKRVLTVEMPGVTLMSLMLMNGSHAVFHDAESLYAYDFDAAPRAIDTGMEQK